MSSLTTHDPSQMEVIDDVVVSPLDYLSLEEDIRETDDLIADALEGYLFSDSTLEKMKRSAVKAIYGDKDSLREFKEIVSEEPGFNVNEYIRLKRLKMDQVKAQQSLLFQSSNFIGMNELENFVNFLVTEIGQVYKIDFSTQDKIDTAYLQGRFEMHKRFNQAAA